MALKLYVDMLSQPCRALDMFLKMNNIPCEMILIALRKGEHKSESYLKINPLGKVPTLVDDGFVLTESVAIFRYLSQKYSVRESFYPKDLQKQAKLDEYLEWQHTNARMKAAKLFIGEVLLKGRGIINVDEAVNSLNEMLNDLEEMFLRDKAFFLGDEVSFADILAVCELIQPTMSGRDVLAGRPKLEAWFERVKRETQPHFDNAHAVFYKSKERMTKASRL